MELSTKIVTKMFIGCPIGPELRMHLNKSKQWKQVSIVPIESRESNIQEIHFQGKDYIGFYLLNNTVSMTEIKKMKAQVLSLLKIYFPEYPIDNSKTLIFPQIFVY